MPKVALRCVLMKIFFFYIYVDALEEKKTLIKKIYPPSYLCAIVLSLPSSSSPSLPSFSVSLFFAKHQRNIYKLK